MLRQLARQLAKSVDVKAVIKPRRSFCRTASRLQETTGEKTQEAAEEKRTILVDKDKNITLIGINRPDQRNAIDSRTAAQLCEAFRTFEADQTSPVAVLYGVGGSFCAGYDILELADDKGTVSIDILMMPEGSVGPTRRQISKPVVCGINGYCVANGLELALMCDLRVMEESAVLGFFNRRFGVPVIDGGTVRLPAMIGLSRALDLILTGRQVEATEALQMGIVNRIVPTGNSLCCAIDLASKLSKFPQGALIHDRNSLYSAVFKTHNFNQAVQNEIMYTSKDIIEQMQEGIKWFIKTFKTDSSLSWLRREKSMADWDDQDVAQAAAQVEQRKQEEKVARIEAEQEQKKEKEKEKKAETKNKSK